MFVWCSICGRQTEKHKGNTFIACDNLEEEIVLCKACEEDYREEMLNEKSSN